MVYMRTPSLTIVLLLAGLLSGCVTSVPGDAVLFGFESDADLDRLNWQCFVEYSISDRFATQGAGSLKVDLYPSAFPGFNPVLPIADWKGFKSLEFEVANPAATEFPISLKIDDRPGPPSPMDRFSRKLLVRSGINHVAVQLDEVVSGNGRRMDLGRIEKLILVCEDLSTPVTFYIDNIRLKK
jgi:hypothetical protein